MVPSYRGAELRLEEVRVPWVRSQDTHRTFQLGFASGLSPQSPPVSPEPSSPVSFVPLSPLSVSFWSSVPMVWTDPRLVHPDGAECVAPEAWSTAAVGSRTPAPTTRPNSTSDIAAMVPRRSYFP